MGKGGTAALSASELPHKWAELGARFRSSPEWRRQKPEQGVTRAELFTEAPAELAMWLCQRARHGGGPRQEPMNNTVLEMEYEPMKPRSHAEIDAAVERFFDRVWYERHHELRYLVANEGYHITPEIWRKALAAAKRVEARYEPDFLDPVDDFNWGMINGKLSALRWVLGDEWDMLDT